MNQKSLFPPAGNHPVWPVPLDWKRVLADRFSLDSRQKLVEFIRRERLQHEVFPIEEDVFRAFQLTSPENVKFVILGQDPYHGPGQAHGLSFSVRDGIKKPPSLANIFKELQSDIGCPVPESGNLTSWARQGGLLLNTVLTVRSGEAHSHRRQGWEQFTDAVIQQISGSDHPVAFVLWGKPAQKKRALIDDTCHLIVEAPHPSPLSAHRGFFGSKPFSKINRFLDSHGLSDIDWSLIS